MLLLLPGLHRAGPRLSYPSQGLVGRRGAELDQQSRGDRARAADAAATMAHDRAAPPEDGAGPLTGAVRPGPLEGGPRPVEIWNRAVEPRQAAFLAARGHVSYAQPVWKSTSELDYLANLHVIAQTQLRGRRRVDGVGRPKFDFHTALSMSSSRSWTMVTIASAPILLSWSRSKPKSLWRLPGHGVMIIVPPVSGTATG